MVGLRRVKVGLNKVMVRWMRVVGPDVDGK